MMAGVVARIFILILCIIVGFESKAELKLFTIKIGKLQVGNLAALHFKTGDLDYYKIHSKVEFNMIMKIKVEYKTECIYKNDVLLKSIVSSCVNGKNYSSLALWQKNKYLINCHAHRYSYTDTSYTTPLRWSVSKLYFHQPDSASVVLAETYGNISQLKFVNKTYLFDIPKSRQLYKYNITGNLSEIEIVNPIKNFKILLKEN